VHLSKSSDPAHSVCTVLHTFSHVCSYWIGPTSSLFHRRSKPHFSAAAAKNAAACRFSFDCCPQHHRQHNIHPLEIWKYQHLVWYKIADNGKAVCPHHACHLLHMTWSLFHMHGPDVDNTPKVTHTQNPFSLCCLL
jgi:hypothetical protein